MQHGGFTLPSFAKINWFLKIGEQRDDGFHEICTAFQTVSLHDSITFEPAARISIECSDQSLPTDKRNLSFRAAISLQERAGTGKGARIRIEKRIPFPGGLGGGSSNAAVTLLGLSSLWGITLPVTDLFDIASELGSDVPFFLVGGTALGSGRGTDLEPVTDVPRKSLLLVTPEAAYSTAEAYGSLGRDRLTSEGPETKLMVCRELAKQLISGSVRPENDFSEAVARLAPETKKTREGLVQRGAESAGLSGSGPTVFGVFENESLRHKAMEYYSSSESLRCFQVESVSRHEYREAMGAYGVQLPGRFS